MVLVSCSSQHGNHDLPEALTLSFDGLGRPFAPGGPLGWTCPVGLGSPCSRSELACQPWTTHDHGFSGNPHLPGALRSIDALLALWWASPGRNEFPCSACRHAIACRSSPGNSGQPVLGRHFRCSLSPAPIGFLADDGAWSFSVVCGQPALVCWLFLKSGCSLVDRVPGNHHCWREIGTLPPDASLRD